MRGVIPLYLRGFYTISLIKGGNKVWTHCGQNLVTTAGFQLAASRMKDATSGGLTHVAIGSDTTPPTISMTALQGTEHERVSATVTVSSNQITLEAAFGTGILGTVTAGEFGIFNAASSGTMFARFVSPSFSISSTDTVDVTWSIVMGA